MSERREHRRRYNQKLEYIAEFCKWLDAEPPALLIFKWRRWKRSRPIRKEGAE